MERQSSSEMQLGLHCADARELSDLFTRLDLPSKPFLTTTITSPPYGALKDYGGASQVGWRQAHADYLADCGKVFEQVHAATKDDGSLWLVADTVTTRGAVDGFRLQLLPLQLAEVAAEAGWTLRDVIIWHKDRTAPWAAAGRLRNAFEYVLFFVKSSSFKHYPKRLAEPVDSSRWWIRFPERYSPDGITPSNVWTIPIPKQGAWGQDSVRHACPFPPELIDRLLHLTTDPGDVVLDPFAGTGTVLARAAALGRKALGLETNRELVETFKLPAAEPSTTKGADPSGGTIWRLRALKYARVVVERAAQDMPTDVSVRLAIVHADVRPKSARPVTGTVCFVLDGRPSAKVRSCVQAALVKAATRAPASKFGVDLKIELTTVGAIDMSSLKRLWRYPNARFYAHDGSVTVGEQLRAGRETKRITILSNLKVSEDSATAEVRD